MQYQVTMDNGKAITCGGNGYQTDMRQFYTAWSGTKEVATTPSKLYQNTGFNGYTKYCVDNAPVCTCSDSTTSWECCDGTKSQAFDTTGRPLVYSLANASTGVANKKTFFGVKMGYKYGFCFIPYPSGASTYITRCMPATPSIPTQAGASGGTGSATVSSDFASALNDMAASQKSATGPQATVSSADVTSYMGAILAGVVSSTGGPQETFSSLCGEVYQNKYVILGSAGLAMLLALVYTQILRLFAKQLVMVVVGVSWALLGVCTAVIIYKAAIVNNVTLPVYFQSTSPDVPTGGAVPTQGVASSTYVLSPETPKSAPIGQATTNQQLLAIAAAVVGVTFFVYTCIICFMFRRIMLAAEVVMEAGRCVAAMPTIILFPLLQWIFIAAYFVWFVILFLYLASAGTFNNKTRQFEWNDQVRRCLILHMFAMFWARSIILSTGNMVIAGATSEVPTRTPSPPAYVVLPPPLSYPLCSLPHSLALLISRIWSFLSPAFNFWRRRRKRRRALAAGQYYCICWQDRES